MSKLILASSSQYRKQQLASLGFEFHVIAPEVDESPHPEEAPRELAQRLATLKATTVSKEFPDHIVIGSDQTGICNEQLLQKPKMLNRAVNMLLSYKNQTVCFYTAVTVLSPQCKLLSDVVKTQVRFRDFTQSEATRYIKLDDPLDCVGSFKSEAFGPLLFESVRSEDPSALMGLPLIRTAQFLREVGVNPLSFD